MRLFQDKVVLVTGGNSGIGKAAALRFSEEGAKVVLSARRQAEGLAVVDEISRKGGEAIFISADVSIEADIVQMHDQIVSRYGHLDCAFNNAGIAVRGPLHELEEEDWDRVLAVNLKGVWLCMKHQIKQFLCQENGGVICNNSSLAGATGWFMSPVYAASKHGVIGLTKSAALQYAEKNIRINAVLPGAILTPLMEDGLRENPEMERFFNSIEPIGRLGKTREVADSVLNLCSPSSSFITGVALPVDGGALAGFWPSILRNDE